LWKIPRKVVIAHLYFQSIHPFEYGNGRIGHVLDEKVLSEGIGQPIFITISKVLEKKNTI
jgi:Fic family protein